MGVINGIETLYQLTNLTRSDIAAIVRGEFDRLQAKGGLNMSLPTIDGDSNNICHVIARKSDTKSFAVAEYYNNWAHCGIQVTPIVDGDVRPTCKQASNERVADREKSRVHAFRLFEGG